MHEKSKPKKYPIKIRLYPEPDTSSLYALVYIWSTRKEMLKQSGTSKTAMACTQGITHLIIPPKGSKKPRRKKPVFAELHFFEERLNIYILAHEVLHATFRWQHRVKLPSIKEKTEAHVSKNEERFCNAHHRMLYQLYNRLSHLKIGGWSW